MSITRFRAERRLFHNATAVPEGQCNEVSELAGYVTQLLAAALASPKMEDIDITVLLQQSLKLLHMVEGYKQGASPTLESLLRVRRALNNVIDGLEKFLERIRNSKTGNWWAAMQNTLKSILGRLKVAAQQVCCFFPDMPEFVVDQEKDMKILKEHLVGSRCGDVRDNWRGILCVVGSRGSGKTTLVNRILNDPEVHKKFDAVSVVKMQKDPQQLVVLKWQRAIWQHLIGNTGLQTFVDKDVISRELRVHLKNKKVLLVSDNVCNSSDFNDISVTNPRNGSMMLVTTRCSEISKGLGGLNFDISNLTDESSMKLFCHHMFGTEEPPSHLRDNVEAVVSRCCRNPLALQVTACAMASRAVEPKMQAMQDIILEDRAAKFKESDERCLENKGLEVLRFIYKNLNEEDQKSFKNSI